MFRIFCLIIGYFVGCIQSAYYVGKIIGKIDIREHGSGNAGSTNMVRTLGIKAGLLTFLCDIAKALIVFIFCSVVFKGSGTFYSADGVNGLLPGLYAGFGLIMGHNYPFQLKFKGGKGIASTLAVFLCLNWQIAVTSYAVGLLVIIATKYVSAGSLVICLLFLTLFIMKKFSVEETSVCLAFSVMAIYRHRANIKRLIQGTENKFSIKKKGVDNT